MFFDDLTPYEYAYDRTVDGVYNIGWLDPEHSFPKGTLAPELWGMLLEVFALNIVNQMRGYHGCTFCGGYDDPAIMLPSGARWVLGSAELWLRDVDEKIYAAPTLVCHYIDVHQYLPPQEFQSAIAETWRTRDRWRASDAVALAKAQLRPQTRE